MLELQTVFRNLEEIDAKMVSIIKLLDPPLKHDLSDQVAALRRQTSILHTIGDNVLSALRASPQSGRRHGEDRRRNYRGYDLETERSRRGKPGVSDYPSEQT